MTDLNCYITTFNCGRNLIDVEYFAANFFNGIKENLPPDLVVLALEEIAPIAYSFLGGSLLAPYITRFITAVNVAARVRFDDEHGYGGVIVRNVGMTVIMVFSKAEISERIRWVETAGVGVGLISMGNKGAAAVRIGLGSGSDSENGDPGADETAVTFVAAHLAPMEWNIEARNRDWKSINEGLVFSRDQTVNRKGNGEGAKPNEEEVEPLLSSAAGNSPGEQQGLFSPTSHLFFAGDLNYRTSDFAPHPNDYQKWPQPGGAAMAVQQFSHLLEMDQLAREMQKSKTLHHLAESPIDFPPTYKYSNTVQRMVAQSKPVPAPGGQHWLWAKHRVPSWCDRVLYLASAPPTVHSYTALPVQPTSDHRPVTLSFSIPMKPLKLSVEDVKPPFPVREDWKEAREAARRYEIAVGILAYLSLTWEGEALLAGTIIGIYGGYLALRAMIGT